MKIINLTPHALSIEGTNGGIIEIAPTDPPARVSSEMEPAGEIGGISISRPIFGAVENLPPPRSGHYYIVSRLVKSRVPGRGDVLVPGAPIRDGDGRVVGARGLSL